VFHKYRIPVPKILAKSDDLTAYLQTYNGPKSLLDKVIEIGHEADVFIIYKEVLRKLASMQILPEIDYTRCIASQRFDDNAALYDLNYVMQYYVTYYTIPYDDGLEREFETLAKEVGNIKPQYFMYRDFQGRNILVNDNNEITFIDFQGGMLGPLQYDVVSLLWQAKAALPADWKEDLLIYYMRQVQMLLPEFQVKQFQEDYYKIVIMRLLQVLGAYGRRGLLEGKQHFIDSIPYAIENLKSCLSYCTYLDRYPYLLQLIKNIITHHESK
jgi:aminoglycoside/choline kinase family phosphotransferase